MADISEPFMLCRTFQKDSLLGIEKHLIKNHVILTFKDRGVLIYNLENKKVINSLSVQQRSEFSCSVVQDPHSTRYIGVLDDLNVCQWSENNGNLVESHRTKVEQPVAQILTMSTDTSGPVVIFRDGSCNLLSKCSTPRKAKKKSEISSLRIISSCVLRQASTTLVALAKYKDAKLSVSLSKIEHDVHFIGEGTVEKPFKDVDLINCCFDTSGTKLISYWSNGFLCMTELRSILDSCLLSSLQQDDITLKCTCINRLHEDSKLSKKTLSIAPVDSTHICMCHEELAQNDVQETISIFDTKFGTRQISVSLDTITSDEPVSSMTSHSSGSTHIMCTDDYICSNSKYGIAACSYVVSPSSLATALGKLAPMSSSEMTSLKPLLCIPHLPDPTKDLQDWVDSTKTNQTTEDEILVRLTSPQKTKTVKSFTQQLNDYLESKCLKKGQDKDNEDKVKKTSFKAKEKFKSKFLLSQHFVLAVLSRCLEETKFFPKEALTSLIKTRCIPGSSSPELLKYLTEKNEVNMILICIKNIQGIPESALVSCIQHAIQAEDSVFGDKKEEEEIEKQKEEDVNDLVFPCPFGKNRVNLLCHLLSYPVNDIFIQQSIRRFTSASIIALMKFLAHIIETAPRTSFSREDSPLSYATALDWTGWIINAHYTSLVLMPDVHDLLKYMSKSVSGQVSLLEKLSRLEGYLHHYKHKQTLPNSERTTLYTVEMIEL